MKIQNIFTDEVVLLSFAIRLNPVIKDQPLSLAVIQKASVVANRGIEPDIKIFTWCIGDFKTEVGRIARDIPIT